MCRGSSRLTRSSEKRPGLLLSPTPHSPNRSMNRGHQARTRCQSSSGNSSIAGTPPSKRLLLPALPTRKSWSGPSLTVSGERESGGPKPARFAPPLSSTPHSRALAVFRNATAWRISESSEALCFKVWNTLKEFEITKVVIAPQNLIAVNL